jgi:hypothetical protein
MPGIGTPPGVVPFGADQTVYLVVDSFGSLNTIYREAEFERADLDTVVGDLLSGQFNNPVRVIAFNTLEHWTEDVSAQVAAEIQSRCDIDGEPVPEHVGDFVAAYGGASRQFALRFARSARRRKPPASSLALARRDADFNGGPRRPAGHSHRAVQLGD